MARFQKGDNYAEAVTEVPIISRSIDTDPNNSDKTLTVPDGEMWHLNSVFITLVTSPVVGNRQIVIAVMNADDVVVGRISAGAAQAASTTRHYLGMQGTYRETAFINTDIQLPIPADAFLPAGFKLRVYDSAAIAPSGDDMSVSASIKIYKGF